MSKDKEIIHKKLDGELNQTETRAFKKKIRKDPGARAEYETLKQVTETSEKVVKPVEPPPDFKQRVIKDLGERG